MSRKVRLALICEDSAQETFVRRFLNRAGWSTRDMRVQKAPPGKGAGEQFVRERFPIELSAYRSKRYQDGQALVVIIDGDNIGRLERCRQIEEACCKAGVDPRQMEERVAIFVPTWNVETWFAYLDGETVDEGRSDYSRLPRPRDCQRHVKELNDMCCRGALRAPAPPALEAGCAEYKQRLAT
jgi:hypothetical protein